MRSPLPPFIISRGACYGANTNEKAGFSGGLLGASFLGELCCSIGCVDGEN